MKLVKVSHRVRILGREITVKSAASVEHVQEVEALVNRKLADAQASVPVGDPQVPVLLALMNMAETCLMLSQELEVQRRMNRDSLNKLVDRIDTALH